MKNDNLEDRFFEKQGNNWFLKRKNGAIIKSFGAIDAYPLLSVLVVKENDLYGLIDKTGSIVVPCEYIMVEQPYSPRHEDEKRHEVIMLMDKDEKRWLADKNGRIVTSRGYTAIGEALSWYDLFSTDTWNGYIGLFDDCEDDDRLEKRGLFDMINVREVLPAIYQPGVAPISELYGVYSKGIPVHDHSGGVKRCKLINTLGEDLISFDEGFTDIGEVPSIYDDEYLVAAKRNGKWGYINIHGTVKIPFRYDFAGPFRWKCAIVGFIRNDGTGVQYGVIGHHDKLVIPFVFRYEPTIEVEGGKVVAKGESLEYVDIVMFGELNERATRRP